MAEPIEAVLFDVDGTLCEYRRSGRELLGVAFEREGVEPFFAVEDYYARYGTFSETTESVDALREECFAAIAAERGRDRALGRALARRFADERDHRDVVPLPGAHEAIGALAEEHELAVVTNGSSEMQNLKLDGIGLADAFETIVYAGYGVAPKPDPAPFHRALDALDVRPERAVHVGNSLEADVAGARAAGLRSVWVPDDRTSTHAGDERADYTLRSLEELTPLLWR